MGKKNIGLLWAATALFCGLARAVVATEQTEPVRPADLPAPVQKTVQTQVGDAQLGAVSKSTEDGEVVFEVEIWRAGKTRSFTVGEDGALKAAQVFLPEIPRPVQKAIRAQVGKGKIESIFKNTEDGESTYDVEMTRGGKTRIFTVGADGELLEFQVVLEETPEAVRKGIQNELGTGELGDIYKTTEEGVVTYEVEITKAGKSRSLTFDADGALVACEEPVALSDTPDPVQKALKAQASGGKLLALHRTTEAGEVTYAVELLKAGKRQSLTLNPQGQLVPDSE